MVSKLCSKCKVDKPVEDFSKCSRSKSGLKSQCKSCVSIAGKKYRNNPKVKKAAIVRKKKWDEENADKYQEYLKKYYEDNKEDRLKYSKEFYKNNREKYKKMRKEYYYANKVTIYEQIKYKRKNDGLYKLKHNIRSSITQAIKRKGYFKTTKTEEMLGCSFEEFKLHIESQWESWMSWDNHGLYNGERNYGWDMDHIVPINEANNENELINLNHYTNFQPLCSYLNRNEKRAKY